MEEHSKMAAQTLPQLLEERAWQGKIQIVGLAGTHQMKTASFRQK
jgi:hypothetical protein